MAQPGQGNDSGTTAQAYRPQGKHLRGQQLKRKDQQLKTKELCAAERLPGSQSAGESDAAREAKRITRLSNSRTMAVAAGISIAAPATGSPPVSVGKPMVSTNSCATSAPARGQRKPRNRNTATAYSHEAKVKSRPSVKTAPQKDMTGAPLTNWKPYQTAAPSRAVASAATIPEITAMARGRAGPEVPFPAGAGSSGTPPSPSWEEGPDGSSGALD